MAITINQLEGKVKTLNLLTNNKVDKYLPYKKGGSLIANVGTFYINQAYGGYQLERICNESGGASNETLRGTKSEIYYQVNAMINGIHIYKEG